MGSSAYEENRIVSRGKPAGDITVLTVVAPDIASAAQPGQFVVVRQGDKGERIPLTIADSDGAEGTVTLVFQEMGVSTKLLGSLNKGDVITDIAGPLGHPSEIRNFGEVVLVGGGVGIAPLYPIAKALKEAGNHLTAILGGRTAAYIIFEDELRAVCDEVIICTDDGSKGEKALVTAPLERVLEGKQLKIDNLWAVGPAVMMRAVSETTRPYKVPTVVSVNTIMVDGTGMCGACRLTEAGKTRFCCTDGPEFDGHLVDFDELLKRQCFYKDEEREALDRFEKAGQDEAGR